MAEPEHETDEILLGQVVISRIMSGDDIVDHVIASTPDGDEIGLAEALGMLELAKYTLIDSRMNCDCGEDDEGE